MKRTTVGIVTGDKTRKTRRVEIARLIRDSKYGKIVRKRTICYVHDQGDESHKGDTVEIEECRPMSRTKRWKLVRVVEKSRFSALTGASEKSEDVLDRAEAGIGEGSARDRRGIGDVTASGRPLHSGVRDERADDSDYKSVR